MELDRPNPNVYETPLYTLGEAARIVQAKPSTVRSWARGRTHRAPGGDVTTVAEPLITTTGMGRRPVVPFVGLAETYVLSAFRRVGVPMQRIRPAVERLEQGIGLVAALASERLMTDGSELLYQYGEDDPGSGAGSLVVVRNGQRVFAEVVERYLRTITYQDGWVGSIRLPQFDTVDVRVDPDINWGQPTISTAGVRVADVVRRIRAGEKPAVVADDFDLPIADVAELAAAA